MLVLRLLVMVLTIICLMDGHAEVSSSTTGIRDRRESPAVKTNEPEVQIHDRKKKKKPKPSKKKKTKPGKKKKPNKAKPTPTKPVTTTPTVSTSTLKTTTILTTPTITTTTTTVSPTTTATTAKTTTSTASATTTLSTTTSTTTTIATSSTASTATTTIPTTATTSSLPTTADSGAGEECKATNGKPCIFPFKDGKEEYNECKNEGGKYFWCATSVYDSGKYKHWSYCPEDRSCPLEGDGECRAENNKPCVFPFKDGEKEYNDCADHGGQYFWCATGTNSAGKYTAWSKCPKDGTCPLPLKSSTPVITPTATAAITTPLTTGTSTAPNEIENKVFSSLTNLVKEESKDGTLEMLETMNKITQTIIEDMKEHNGDNDPKNIESNHTFEGGYPPFQSISLGYKQGMDFGETRKIHQYFEYDQNTVDWIGSYTPVLNPSDCCSKCRSRSTMSNTEIFDYFHSTKQCYCYRKYPSIAPKRKINYSFSTGECGAEGNEGSLNPPGCAGCVTCHQRGSTQAYKEFHYGNDHFQWRSLWSQIRRSAAFSHVQLTNFHHKTFKAHSYFTHTLKETGYRGQPICSTPEPMTHSDNYVHLGYDRGHLLGSELIRTFFNTMHEDSVKVLYQAMMNIFPQDNKCNQGKGIGLEKAWRGIEKDVKIAGAACTASSGKFYLTHALRPSGIKLKSPFENMKDIYHSNEILTNYCCVKGTGLTEKVESSRAVITTNPTDCQDNCKILTDSEIDTEVVPDDTDGAAPAPAVTIEKRGNTMSILKRFFPAGYFPDYSTEGIPFNFFEGLDPSLWCISGFK